MKRSLALLLCLALALLAGCGSSFLGMRENYGISLPENCEITDRASVFIGPDRIAIKKLQYSEDTITGLFPWRAADGALQKDLDRMFQLLTECERRDPEIRASGLIAEITNKLPALRYYKATEPEASGVVCCLLLDTSELVLYVCEANY